MKFLINFFCLVYFLVTGTAASRRDEKAARKNAGYIING